MGYSLGILLLSVVLWVPNTYTSGHLLDPLHSGFLHLRIHFILPSDFIVIGLIHRLPVDPDSLWLWIYCQSPCKTVIEIIGVHNRRQPRARNSPRRWETFHLNTSVDLFGSGIRRSLCVILRTYTRKTNMNNKRACLRAEGYSLGGRPHHLSDQLRCFHR